MKFPLNFHETTLNSIQTTHNTRLAIAIVRNYSRYAIKHALQHATPRKQQQLSEKQFKTN